MLTRWVQLNIRLVQGFTNLLNQTLNAERSFKDSNFLTSYASVGICFLF